MKLRFNPLSFLTSFLLAAVVLALAVLLEGYILSVMWGWFMAPVFSLPRLGIAPAIGIALVINFLTHQHVPSDKKVDLGEVLWRIFFTPFSALFIGYIVHSFM